MTEEFKKGTEQLSQKPQEPKENTAKYGLIWVLDTTEKIKQAKNVLSPEQYQAIWEKNILDERMTGNKLTVIWYMLWVEDIKQITPEKLVEMPIKEINEYIANNY